MILEHSERTVQVTGSYVSFWILVDDESAGYTLALPSVIKTAPAQLSRAAGSALPTTVSKPEYEARLLLQYLTITNMSK